MNVEQLAAALVEFASQQGQAQPVQLMPAPYVTVALAATLTGYSEKAIRRKIQDGIWLEGREYRKAPDDRVLISMKGFAAWVEQGHPRKTTRQL
jgi:hypothetical protein